MEETLDRCGASLERRNFGLRFWAAAGSVGLELEVDFSAGFAWLMLELDFRSVSVEVDILSVKVEVEEDFLLRLDFFSVLVRFEVDLLIFGLDLDREFLAYPCADGRRSNATPISLGLGESLADDDVCDCDRNISLRFSLAVAARLMFLTCAAAVGELVSFSSAAISSSVGDDISSPMIPAKESERSLLAGMVLFLGSGSGSSDSLSSSR
jgi:hypothetical protein